MIGPVPCSRRWRSISGDSLFVRNRVVRPRWVFWDLGDTLLNEDPLRYHIYELLLAALHRAGRTVTFRDLVRWREELVVGGDTGPHYTIAERELPDEERSRWIEAVRRYTVGEWERKVALVPGAGEVLCQLAGQYRMGIIADQPEGIEGVLRRLGVRDYFAVMALDSAIGHHKPDERLFRWAVRAAECAPEEAVMVGNRLDVDVAPARRIGMRTIFCAFPPNEKGWEPDTENGWLYREAIARTPNWRSVPDPSRPDETPDATVGTISSVPGVMSVWASAEPDGSPRSGVR